MVIFGGLEIVAAGYIIHKHQKNKQEKERIKDEAAALEEQQYRLFPPKDNGRHSHSSHSEHRRRRSHSRHSNGRRHSTDGKHRRESPRPPMPQTMTTQPPVYNNIPVVNGPPPPPQAHPQDMKYGWTDGPAQQQQQQQPQDPAYPPTGWPAHWAQSQTPSTNATLSPYQQPPQQRRSEPRGRSPARVAESPRVRFAPSVRSSSRTPPPSYRS